MVGEQLLIHYSNIFIWYCPSSLSIIFFMIIADVYSN